MDRDGTLNVRPEEHQYVTSERDFVWLPRAAEALARLREAGYLLAVVSNQRGVARGLVQPQVLKDIEGRIRRDLMPFGCEIEAFRYCTHEENGACECRKPKPGMLLDLARELGIHLETSWMIGDSEGDIRAGEAAGCRTALVGYPTLGVEPDVVGPSLADVSDLIVFQATRI